MMLTSFLGGLIALIITGLCVSAFANHYQEKRARLAQQIKQLRASGDHLSEIAQKIDQVSTNKSISAELIGMAAKNFEKIVGLKADSNQDRSALESAQDFANRLAQGRGTTNPSAKFESLEEIAKAKQLISDAEKIFRRMYDCGNLDNETFSQYYTELKWLYLDVEVSSYIHQATLAAGRSDHVKRGKYLKHALNILKKSSSVDQRKQAKLAEVQALIEQPKTASANP